jgi:hypothetical protein
MTLPNPDPGTVRLPLDQVRFTDVHVEPWPDGQRVRVHISLTPFEQKPSLEFVVVNSQGKQIASATILETMNYRLVITLHLRPVDPSGLYRLYIKLYYPESKIVCEEREIPFEAHLADNPQ